MPLSPTPFEHPQTHTVLPSPFALSGQSQSLPVRRTTFQEKKTKKQESAVHFSWGIGWGGGGATSLLYHQSKSSPSPWPRQTIQHYYEASLLLLIGKVTLNHCVAAPPSPQAWLGGFGASQPTPHPEPSFVTGCSQGGPQNGDL